MRKKVKNTRERKSLAFVEIALREAGIAQNVAQIIERIDASGVVMNRVTKSHTPYNSISRDLALDIRDKGDKSRFVRVGLGMFTLCALVKAPAETDASVWTDDAGVHA